MIGVQLLERSGRKASAKNWERFEKTGLPARKYEEYKFTPMTSLLEKEFTGAPVASDIPPSALDLNKLVETPNQLVFYNGKLLTCEIQDSQVVIRDLNELPAEEKFHPTWDDPFHLMNKSIETDGKYIQLQKGSILENPVYIRYVTDKRADQALSLTRNYFHAGENSEITIIEEFIYLGENVSFDNVESHFIVDRSSRVHSYKLQLEGENQLHAGNIFVQQEKDSLFNNYTITLKGRMARNNVQVSLNDEHCETHLFGLYLLNGKSHVDNHTTVDHRFAHCYSNELYKGILDESGTGVFNGKIYVRPGAQKTNAFQSNNNILLSDSATLHTKPQLEIWADDVKCSHGCTSGQLDKEAMFYLQTRGLSREQARALLLKAFASEVLEQMKVDGIRQHIENRVDHLLFKRW